MTSTAEGDAVSFNSAAAQIVGATVQQLQAQNFRNLESWKRGNLFRAADQALETSEPHNLEARFVTSFGKAVWLSCRFVPFRHKDRRHLLCLFSEITERKRAEQVIERGLQRLTEAQRIGQIGDWEYDLATQAITWSPQVFKIFGRDPRLGPPRNYEENTALFDAASQAVQTDQVARAIESGEAQDYQLRAHRPNGRFFFDRARVFA